ncbi:hypothetical protein DFO46_3948 [Rhizobium sp. AG855]|nr:hypothetical protein DFO46_3948 [Rhizobium sp. AG855]
MMGKLSFSPSVRTATPKLFLRAMRSDLLHQGGVDV